MYVSPNHEQTLRGGWECWLAAGQMFQFARVGLISCLWRSSLTLVRGSLLEKKKKTVLSVYRLTLNLSLLREQDLFPWKQGTGGELATPPKWEKSRALYSATQVSPQMAWLYFRTYNPTQMFTATRLNESI